MYKYILVTLCTTTLMGCMPLYLVHKMSDSNENKAQKTVYVDGKSARIRIYGQNNKPTLIWHDIDCLKNTTGTKINVGGTLKQAFGSLFATEKNSSIGIPETKISKSIDSQSVFLSKAFFKEFVIEANKPVNIENSYIVPDTRLETSQAIVVQHGGSCKVQVSFVPQAGHDYEVVGANGSSCGVNVYDIDASGKITPVALDNAYVCKR